MERRQLSAIGQAGRWEETNLNEHRRTDDSSQVSLEGEAVFRSILILNRTVINLSNQNEQASEP